MFAGRSISNPRFRPAFPVGDNQVAPSLPQMFIPIGLKPRRINTYAPPPRFAVFWPQSSKRNSFISNTYQKSLRKSFRIRTYKNRGEGPLRRRRKESRPPVLSFRPKGKEGVG